MGKSKTMGDVVAQNKVRVSSLIKTIKRVIHNSERFVQAVALVIVVIFGFLNYKEITNDVYRYALVVSMVVVGLRAMYELVRFLDRD